MIIGIDIDDTLINTKEYQKIYWKEYINNNPNPNYSEELPKDINHFGSEYIDEFWNTYRYKLAYNPSFKEDSIATINKLHNDYKIFIVTSRREEQYPDLLNWFKKNNIYIDKICFGIRKKGEFCKENNIKLLIDDDYIHCKNCIDNNIDAIMFNNESNEILNINNWKKIYDYIKKNY